MNVVFIELIERPILLLDNLGQNAACRGECSEFFLGLYLLIVKLLELYGEPCIEFFQKRFFFEESEDSFSSGRFMRATQDVKNGQQLLKLELWIIKKLLKHLQALNSGLPKFLNVLSILQDEQAEPPDLFDHLRVSTFPLLQTVLPREQRVKPPLQ